ncbi:MAG TPA: NUDIX domain-containing protein [Planctomycetaceae bacterium]|nr:NUDIX domain-containing protein [Planctomycetaceae bacterium]
MTRTSDAALALITRVNLHGQTEYLTQWNDAWTAYSLIGGHVEDGETFRQACLREIVEELECAESDAQLAPAAFFTLRFREFSKAAREETDYQWQVFVAELSDALLQLLPAICEWVTAEQILIGRAANGKTIADQVRRVLKAVAEQASNMDSDAESQDNNQCSQPSNRVTWMADARRDLSAELCRQVECELLLAFGVSEAGRIVVKQRFRGFSDEPQRKLILAVEVQGPNGARASVVKIGDVSKVGGDHTGWQSCAVSRGTVSRLFIAPVLRHVATNRAAILYPDVYQFYYNNGRDDEPKELETIVAQSILRNSPTSSSVERILTQVFTEAHRCLYRYAQEDTTNDHVLRAVTRSLNLHKPITVLERWDEDEFVKLRRGAAWLTCGKRQPDSPDRPEYIDPVDYLRWVLRTVHPSLRQRDVSANSISRNASGSGLKQQERQPEQPGASARRLINTTPAAPAAPAAKTEHEPADGAAGLQYSNCIPKMLIGPAHGDLHGRNIIVGVVRGEAEWPAVFDFDKMADDNMVAWDFAKLEMELKCRLFQQLLDEAAERAQIQKLLGIGVQPAENGGDERAVPNLTDTRPRDDRTTQEVA